MPPFYFPLTENSQMFWHILETSILRKKCLWRAIKMFMICKDIHIHTSSDTSDEQGLITLDPARAIQPFNVLQSILIKVLSCSFSFSQFYICSPNFEHCDNLLLWQELSWRDLFGWHFLLLSSLMADYEHFFIVLWY